MNAFLREHAVSLVGSTLLHLLAAAGVLAAAWYVVAPKITMPATIDAYIAAPRPARPAPEAPAPQPVPQPAPQPATPPAEDAAVREQKIREAHEAEVRAAAREKAAEAEREAEAAAAKRRAAEADAARKREQAAAAAKQKAEAEKRRVAAVDAKQRAARETYLARELAREEQRIGAENSGLNDRYAAEIRARVERAWIRPPTAKPGLRCIVNVTQVPGGTVTDVKIGECNGDAAVLQSITLAVFRASPLPAPPDTSLFQRSLKLVFAPDD